MEAPLFSDADTVYFPLPEGGEICIRPFAESDSFAALTALLHRAYSSLAAMGFRFFATHQTPADTASRIENSFCWVGEYRGEPVATVCLYSGRHPEGRCEWYSREGVWRFGQFAVEPHLQRYGLGSTLMDIVEGYARRNGAEELALDTAEGAHHLIAYYSRRGYRPVGHVQWDITNYRSIVMSKALAEKLPEEKG